MAECSITSLETDACENSFTGAAQDEQVWRALVLQLLCNISQGGSPGGAQQVFSGNYGGGEPSQSPIADEALAIDTSNGTIWSWYDNAWH